MSQQSVVRLKELLFDKERTELEMLARRLDEVAERAGSDARFRHAVAKTLDGALRDAEVQRHREVSDALAPLVVRTVRTEVTNQQEQLPALLYPHIGKMVRDYVASAIRDLMEELNRRIESGLTQNRFMLRMKSITSGRSMAEVALAANETLAVEELHLIQRGSGELLAHWSRDATPAADEGRGTLFSGMLTAMTAFIEEVYEADKANLRAIDFGEHTVFLRGSPNHLLAAKCKGVAGEGVQRLLDEEFLNSLETLAGSGMQPSGGSGELATLAHRIEERMRAQKSASQRSRSRPLRALAWLIGIPLVAWLGWSGYVRYQTTTLQNAASAAIAEVPALKGYPTRARVVRGGGTIEVSGLAPSAATRALIIEKLRGIAPNAHIVETIGVVPGASADEIEAEMSRLRSGLSELETSVARTATRRALDRASKRLANVTSELGTLAQATPDAAQRRALTSTREAVVSTGRALEALRQGSNDGADEGARLANTIRSAEDKLRTAELTLREMVGASAPDDTDGLASNPSPYGTAEAEALALRAERIAVLIIAAKARLAQRPLEARLAELTRRIEGLQTAPSPRQQLEAWTRENALFFDGGTEYRDAAKAQAQLDSLAELMRRSDAKLRIIGYTDERGTSTANLTLAQSRAQRVAADLEQRGIPAGRLVTVGRTNLDISNRSGPGSANRRATFEVAFAGEE